MKNKSVSLLSAFIGVFFFCFAPVTNADSQISFTATSSTAANLDNVTVYSQFPDGPTDDFYLFNTDGSYETVIGAGTYFVDSGTLTMDQLLVPVGSGTVHFVFVPANSSAVGCDTSYSACLASNTPDEDDSFTVLPSPPQISFTATSSTAANLDNVTVYSQFPDGPTDDFYLFNTDGSYETVIGAGTYFVDSGTLTMDQLLVPVGSGTVHFVFVPANSSAVGCDTSYSACLASNTPTEEETFDVLP